MTGRQREEERRREREQARDREHERKREKETGRERETDRQTWRRTERERQTDREKDRERERERPTTVVIFKGDAVALAQPLSELSQHLLVPVLSEPHHLAGKQTTTQIKVHMTITC